MPSLSTKAEPVVAMDPAEFSKNMVVMMEKKIRNLEKRKSRLEDSRAKQASGHTLTDEQLKAVAKLDDVLSQIELLQDLTKQFTSYGAEVVKQQKKHQKRERFEQIENDRKRLAEVLCLQNVLNALGAEETRKAFVDGNDGAIKLDEQELSHLDELYKILNPERGVDASLVDQLKTSSEHLQSVLDGRDKAVCGTTYRQLKDLITKIKSCPYFSEAEKVPEASDVEDVNETSTETEFVVVKSEEVPHAESAEVQSSLPPEILPEQAPPQQAEQIYQQQNVAPQQAPEPPKTFEKIVENVQGRFNFIQDSEIDVDSPSHVDPAVVAVHQMPKQYQPSPIVHHSQQEQGYSGSNLIPMTMIIENSTFVQQNNDIGYQQYNMPSDSPQPIPLPTDTTAQVSGQSMFSQAPHNSDNEPKFDNGMTFESSSMKHHDKPSHNDDYQPRSQGQMRRGGGGYRGGRGSNNGFGGGRGGGFRGNQDRPSYRGDRSAGGDRPQRHHSPSGNSFPAENRRGGRGGQRGGSGGSAFRGSGRGGRGSNGGGRGGFRGQHQQSTQIQ